LTVPLTVPLTAPLSWLFLFDRLGDLVANHALLPLRPSIY
jgi:hypothetical protein